MAALIERLSDLPPASLEALVAESEQGGLRFMRRLVEEWASGANHWEGYRQNIVATLASVEPAEQVVAERDDTIVGTVLLYPPRRVRTLGGESLEVPWPEVRLLAVASAARGQGIGAALMRECVRRARGSGTSALSLHTTDLMQTAMRMYERMGFVRAPQLDFHPAPGLTVKGYRLDLAGA